MLRVPIFACELNRWMTPCGCFLNLDFAWYAFWGRCHFQNDRGEDLQDTKCFRCLQCLLSLHQLDLPCSSFTYSWSWLERCREYRTIINRWGRHAFALAWWCPIWSCHFDRWRWSSASRAAKVAEHLNLQQNHSTSPNPCDRQYVQMYCLTPLEIQWARPFAPPIILTSRVRRAQFRSV